MVAKLILDKKVKLKIKRDNLEEAMQDMTNELCLELTIQAGLSGRVGPTLG